MRSRRLHVKQLLEGYVPDPGQEPDHDAMMRLVSGDGEVLSENHFDPGHFTASGFVLAPERSRLVLVHHVQLGMWVQPGGHVDPEDADVLAAAEREIYEETGLDGLARLGDGLFDVDVHVIPARPTAPSHRHFDLRFLFAATGEALRVSLESFDVQWVTLSEMETMGTDASVRRASRKLVEEMRSP